MTHDCWNGQDANGNFYLECSPHDPTWFQSLTQTEALFVVAFGLALLAGAVVLWLNLSTIQAGKVEP